MKKIAITFLLAMPFFGNAEAQSIQKYFGYLSGDSTGVTISPPATPLNEFQSSSNLYSIGGWSGDESAAGRSVSTQYILSQLALAKAAHIHATIPGNAFLFQLDSTSGCVINDPGAAQSWNTFVQAMVSAGYIDVASPDRGVVSAIYVVDEPNGPAKQNGPNCLPDVSGAPNPALQNAVNAIRSNPSTATIPLASILSGDVGFANIAQGMQLFDWIGFDRYSDSSSEWQADQATLESYAPTKKYILVPGAMSNDDGGICVGTQSPTPFIEEFQTDPRAVWLAPFVWFSPGSCLGVRDNPSLNATYTTLGTSIKAQGCSSSLAARNFCKPQPIAQIVSILFSNNN